MGLGPTWSCSDNNSCSGYGVNPDPHKFKIIWMKICYGNTIMMVHYPNCITFGGNKLLLLRGIHSEKISKLDPHFLNEEHPVIARFLPTKEGEILAKAAAASI
jgi:hypothetical protein